MSQSVLDTLKTSGRLPGLRVEIYSLFYGVNYVFSSDYGSGQEQQGLMAYTFDSNILVPVDGFSITLIPSTSDRILDDAIREGDEVRLYIGDALISTGIIDQTEVEVDADGGERIN